jgi:hypothetical protein
MTKSSPRLLVQHAVFTLFARYQGERLHARKRKVSHQLHVTFFLRRSSVEPFWVVPADAINVTLSCCFAP